MLRGTMRTCDLVSVVALSCLIAQAGCGDGSRSATGSPADLTAANLNLLHGLFCDEETAACRLEDRVDLLFEWIEASGCPDVVALQEIWDPAVPFIEARLRGACSFDYEMVYERTNTVDDAIVLTRYPAVAVEVVELYKRFRYALRARIDHPIGPVDIFTTHLASGADGAGNPCEGDCPRECVAAGAQTVRQCQAVQLALLVEARHGVATPALVLGDMNARPGDFEYEQFVGRGWPDVHLAAGNPECDPNTGFGCTSSGRGGDLVGLESPDATLRSRVDYIFLVPPGASDECLGVLDSGRDDDGDGTATGGFADAPNPFAESCGPIPLPICWPSNHNGVLVDLNCS